MKDETGKVFFDEDEQKELDRIIGERVSRVKSEKPTDYEDLKEIENEIAEFFPGATPAEKKAAIKEYKEQLKRQNNNDEKTDEELEEIKKERREAKQREEQKKKTEEDWKKQVEEFSAEYPDITVDELNKNEQFIDFVSGSGWSLKTAYAKYIKVYGEIESETISKVKSKELRSTSGGKSNNSGGNHGLTAEQKASCDEWNRKNPRMQMSYKEFAERNQ